MTVHESSTLEDSIKEIAAEVFLLSREEISEDMSPEDIDAWDSFGQLNLVSSIEERYSITFEVEEIFQIVSIKSIIDLVSKKI